MVRCVSGNGPIFVGKWGQLKRHAAGIGSAHVAGGRNRGRVEGGRHGIFAVRVRG